MSLAQPEDALVGRTFGGFVLRQRIGEGGFGGVYRAEQPGLDREAVVKVLHARYQTTRGAGERFLREAKLASKLDHPYAAHIYAFGAEPGGELWIAMELVRGTPLDRVLEAQGPIPLERFVPLLDRICEVVHTAHEQGIVHRDLKPGNVMVLSRAGRLLPKLLDFGIAKGLAPGASGQLARNSPTPPTPMRATPQQAMSETIDSSSTMPVVGAVTGEDDLALTQRGAIIGSPLYMAPEQWVDAGLADARTDLYALGVLAYECLTGSPPFTAATVSALAYSHAYESPPPLGKRFPPALDVVFAKVLAKAPSERFDNALELAAAFRKAAGAEREVAALPALDPVRRQSVLTAAPQPIAEAVAALGTARNAHQQRDAIVQLARTLARFLGLVSLACRSRVVAADEPAAVASALRKLHRQPLGDGEWFELAQLLTRAWTDRRDAYPVPELVDAMQRREVVAAFDELLGLRERDAASEDALVELLDHAMVRVASLLDAFAFLSEYPLVVASARGVAERWMGVRLAQRATVAVRGKDLPPGTPALLDSDGVPVLALAPLFQIAPPAPGAPLELFLFDGRDARGAKLVALPAGFEYHDDALWSWFRAQLATTIDDAHSLVSEEKPPYRGLQAFSADDNASFFGREKQVDAFVNRLKIQPLLAVVGRSGAGKSSFVHAGVVSALGWRVVTMRPGASPIGALIARLEHAGFAKVSKHELVRDRDALGELLRADAAARGPVLVVVDQLEEMFTVCQDAEERRGFAEALASAARAAEDPVRVIVTLRDDFLVRTEQVPALRNRLAQGLQLLTVPAAADLERIVVEPARRAGYEIEGDLAAEMVREVADQPGALPLISFTAQKLWELRDRQFKQLTRAAYKTLGGVGGALARHADITLDDMPADERALAREAFRHLVTSQNTRAVLARGDLRQLLGGTAQANRMIEQLVAARLLVASENEQGEETVEIVHEALLVAWPRLVEWRRDDAEGVRFREQLRAAAEQWKERGRAKGLLWRGDALADYTRWRARHPGPLTDLEAAFADASVALETRGRRSRRLLLAAAFATLGAGTLVFAIQGAQKRAQANQLHDTVQRQYEDQGRRLVLAGDPQQALVFLDHARDMGASGAAHDFLVAEAKQATEGQLIAVHHEHAVRSPRFSHDGKRFVTAGYDHAVRIWDATTGALERELAHPGPVVRASFSPDDATVLTSGPDGLATLWDVASGARRHAFAHRDGVWCADFSPDGKLLATGGDDDQIEVADAATGEARFRVHGDGAGFKTCAWSRDSALLAAGENLGTTRVWDARTGQLVHELHGATTDVNQVAFSPDGTRLVTATWAREAVVWELASEHRQHVLAHKGAVMSAEWSGDGKWIVTASADRTAALWHADTGVRELTLAGHASAVNFARFTPDQRYIVTVSGDASAQLWDASDGRAVARWRGHRDAVFSPPDFDPSGTRVVTSSDDGTAIVWRLAAQERVRWLDRRGKTSDAQFSPDGTHVVTAGPEGTRVWLVRAGTVERTLPPAFVLAYRPDGAMIAAGTESGELRIWDAASGAERVIATGSKAVIGAVAWSADGTRLCGGSDDGLIGCWTVADARPLFATHVEARVFGLAWFPAGDRLLTTGDDSTIRTWDAGGALLSSRHDPDLSYSVDIDPGGARVLGAEGRQRAKIWDAATGATIAWLDGHVDRLLDARWSRDGAFAVTAALDGTARIWDGNTGALLATITHAAPVYVARFAPDGRSVIVVDDTGGVAIHELPGAKQ